MILIANKEIKNQFRYKYKFKNIWFYLSNSDFIAKKDNNSFKILYGTPILYVKDFSPSQLDKIGGNFVLIEVNKNGLTIFTDPFSIMDIFYSTDCFFISDNLSNYKLIEKNIELDLKGVSEFIFTSTTFNSRTTIKNVKKIPPQSRLIYVDPSNIFIERNYYLKYHNKITNKKTAVDELTKAIKSAAKDIAKKANYLLLSSGMDSRAILAAYPHLECLTASPLNKKKFPSFCLASNLTNIYDLKHHLIPYSEKDYIEFSEEGAALSNCRTTFIHMHFSNLKKGRIAHGLLFDALIKGSARQSLLEKIITQESCKIVETKISNVEDYLVRFFTKSQGMINKKIIYKTLQKEYQDFIKFFRDDIEKEVREYRKISSSQEDIVDFIWATNQIQLGLEKNLNETNGTSSAFISMHPKIIKWHFSVPSKFRFGDRLLIESIRQIDSRALAVRKENYLLNPTKNRLINCWSHLIKYMFQREYSWIKPEKYLWSASFNKRMEKLWDVYECYIPYSNNLKKDQINSIFLRENICNYLLWLNSIKKESIR